MKVLAISGWKGSGKDTIASHIIKNHRGIRTAFADPLKDMASKEYDFPREWADDPAYKESPLLNLPIKPEDAFTKMVTDFMRGEFRDQNGKRYGEGTTSSQLYWTPRALCILKGSVNRSVDSAFWVKQAIKDIRQKEYDLRGIHVITDLRYTSELGQLKEAFGNDVVFIRVNRFESSTSNDPSERDLDNAEFDFYVDNSTTKEAAFLQVDDIINRI